ncbi:MAG: MBL fold metallo-hydrolase [Gemmataceae bacterium]
MALDPVFTVTYWGVTGTLTAPLKPAEVTDKVVRAITTLVEQGRLAGLQPGPDLRARVLQQVEQGLPFPLRSTFGGNTTCVEIKTPDALLIFDCGSGCRELGIDLDRRWNAPGYQGQRAAHVLLTHPHLDHALAAPYVGPFYDSRNSFTIWGSDTVLKAMRAVLGSESALAHTYFPPSIDLMKALKDIRQIQAGMTFAIGSTQITTYALRHPGSCLAYRLENAGRVFVFATDHEQATVPDLELAAFAHGADVLYTEGQYLQAEYDGMQLLPGETTHVARRGWGHSPVEACVSTAVAAAVKSLHVGHREPMRTDEQIFAIEGLIQKLMTDELRHAGRDPNSCQALIPYEGMTFQL